jgi:CelD/BcsL family acetyltransferase involved in cellulose biosynthesis
VTAVEQDLRLQTVDPCSDPLWAELMAGPGGSLFSSPPWLSAIVDTYGIDLGADVLVDPRGAPVAGMVRARLDDLRGVRINCSPFADRVDPVADGAQWPRLAEPVLAAGVPVELRVLHAEAPLEDERFRQVNELAWHGTALDRSEEELLAGLNPTVRHNLRASQRRGVTVSLGAGLEDVRAFHELQCLIRKQKYRLLAQPLAFFERLQERFAPSGQLLVALAHHEGDVIGGVLCIRWNDVMYYKFAASRPERLKARPNEALAWACMRAGQEWGCTTFDWGVSDLDQPGLVAYKGKYATEERRVRVLRHVPAGHDGSRAAETGAVLGQLTALLTRDDVPDDVTRRAGELLYRYFC